MPRLTMDGSKPRTAKRFDSDADCFRFPEGGVHGRVNDALRHVVSSGDITVEIERSVNKMREEIDALRMDVDSAMRFPLSDTWPPRAA